MTYPTPRAVTAPYQRAIAVAQALTSIGETEPAAAPTWPTMTV
ncbi:MAG: hypothetical protein R3F53_15715 [Gammaproteobacteria bacterium]